MLSLEQCNMPRTSIPAPAGLPPLMGCACDGIGGFWGAPLLPASLIPSAHLAGRPSMHPESPLPIVRRPWPSSFLQAAPGPSSLPLIWAPSRPCLDPENLEISPHSKSCRIVISPGENHSSAFAAQKTCSYACQARFGIHPAPPQKPPCLEHKNQEHAALSST